MIVGKPPKGTSFTPPHLNSLPQPRPALPTAQRPHTTFLRPLFSYSYELLFPQLLYFDNDLNCPGVSPPLRPPRSHSEHSVLRFSRNRFAIRRLRTLILSCSFFPHSFPLFSMACALFAQNH